MDSSSVNIKEEIHQLIIDIDDIDFLKAVQNIISAKIQDNYLTDEEIQIVEERREKYLKNEGETYKWDEVKACAKSSKSK